MPGLDGIPLAVIPGSTAVRCSRRWSNNNASPARKAGVRTGASRATSSTMSGDTDQSNIAPSVPVGSTVSIRRGTISSPGESASQSESASQRFRVRTAAPRNAPSWCQFVLVSIGTRRRVHLFAESAGRSPRCAVTSSTILVSSSSSHSSNSMRGESTVHTAPLARTQLRRPPTRYVPGLRRERHVPR